MKVKKLLLATILVAVAIVLMFSSNTYAATGSWRLGTEALREGITTKNSAEIRTTRYSYRMNSKPVLKIVDKTTGTADFSNAIYCLKAGQGFGSDRATMADVTYNTYFNMLTEKSAVNGILNLSNSNYGSVLWLLDNIYLPKQTPIGDRQRIRDNLLFEAFKKDLNDKGINSNFFDGEVDLSSTNIARLGRLAVQNSLITDDDMEVVQQWAIWYFTNPNSSDGFHTDTLLNPQVNQTGEGAHSSFGDDDETRERLYEMNALYNYLLAQAKANSNYSKVPTQITFANTNPIVKQASTLNTNYVIAGPFEISKVGNTSYTAEGKVVDANGREVAYTICDANGTQLTGIRTLKEAVGRGQFYVRIEKSAITTNNIKDIKLYMTYTTTDRNLTFWTVNGSTVDQPVVVIDSTPKTTPIEITAHIPEFDLALRKYITSVTRDGVTVNIAELTGRRPNINKATIATEKTAEYKHRKDPVPVQTGDLVNYTITIYNEGEIAGRATEIIDYLPAGLEFHSAISTDYTFTPSADKRKITITPKNSNNLSAYNGTTLDSVEIKFTCIVTKKEEKGIGVDTVLTNIAEITEAYDVNNVKMELVGDDRDSLPNNLRKPTDTNLPSYKGNDDNKTDLVDRDYHYEGQQDDDDFEKLKVTTPEFDLALRKFITKIDETEITDREPVVDTTPLKNGEQTAIYKHAKNPLTVGIGSIIRYTIRVYNEAEYNGYVTVIEDYLPAELELVPASESEINAKYGWTENGRIITTTYLNGTVINAFDGGDTLDFKDVEVECRVKPNSVDGKVLTNIAQINGDSGDDRDSTPSNAEKPSDTDLPSYKGNDENPTDLSNKDYYYKGQEDDDDFEKVVIYRPGFDLALRKFITKVGDNEVTDRIPDVDTTPLKTKKGSTAIYTHTKNPLVANIGDTIRYTIRVYNEGEADGYATVIEDYLPEELEFVPREESEINDKYGWTANGRVITTEYLKDTVIHAFDGGDDLDYKDVEIECRIKSTENLGKVLTNIAQINAAIDINGNKIENPGDDRDSVPGNVKKPTDANLPDYAEHQEDDDDFEKIKIYQPIYDLALRKFITQVNETEVTDRVPEVDVGPLLDDSEETTTAIYTHKKTPVLVKTGDIVVYTIRVYNEGKVNAFAEEIKDNIPEGLEFVIDNKINIDYRWKLSADGKQVSTDYLSKDVDEDNVIKAFDSNTMDTLDYKDVKIAFKVIEPNTSTRVLVNIAEIKDDDGKDIDSIPDNDEEDEDDIDKEYVKLKYFDLALRKFITKVESKTGENLQIETDETKDVSREPKVEIGEDGKIKYVHPKDPVIVANSDIVIYTLRVYNEGNIDGYAEEIKDDVPVGLELVPDHEINTEYGWVMYDKDGNATDDVAKAKTIRTTYLSEENGEDNIIKAFDRETMDSPAYKEVKVAFKVVERNVGEERIVINTAEISEDSDDDIDSKPDNDEEDEDDIDKEYIKLKYFDLSLLKWVSKMMVTEKGETKVYETGFNGSEAPEPVVKYEVKTSQLKSIVIKYEYGIKITNEGQIPGYAKEVADYIPKGLEFIPEDNPLWTLKEDGKIVTTQLENTLLQPGESAIVTVVFKWINDENNFGQFENIAEISKDYNEKDAEDIDSTPDNQIPSEDDQDNAFVLINPKTGQVIVFVVLPTIILGILVAGIILIKKYVL